VRTVSVNTVHWFDASSLDNANELPHNTYITSTVPSWAKFFVAANIIFVALQIFEQFFRTVLPESQKRQIISCRARNRF